MKNAKSTDKNLVIELLESSFDTNMSVNYIIPQNQNRAKRKRALMNYSFDICTLFGKVLISNDEKGCALILYPDKKKSTIKSIFLDLKLIIECIGFRNIKKTLSREALIRKLHPNELMSYIWYIGVDPEYQHQEIGSALLN